MLPCHNSTFFSASRTSDSTYCKLCAMVRLLRLCWGVRICKKHHRRSPPSWLSQPGPKHASYTCNRALIFHKFWEPNAAVAPTLAVSLITFPQIVRLMLTFAAQPSQRRLCPLRVSFASSLCSLTFETSNAGDGGIQIVEGTVCNSRLDSEPGREGAVPKSGFAIDRRQPNHGLLRLGQECINMVQALKIAMDLTRSTTVMLPCETCEVSGIRFSF